MRSPNPKTLSTAIAKAEAFRPCAGTALHLTPAEARALIYSFGAEQALVRFDGNLVLPRRTSAAEVWDTAGYSDVERITGCWDTRPAIRPKGPVFVVTISRAVAHYEVDIPGLAAPKAEG